MSKQLCWGIDCFKRDECERFSGMESMDPSKDKIISPDITEDGEGNVLTCGDFKKVETEK